MFSIGHLKIIAKNRQFLLSLCLLAGGLTASLLLMLSHPVYAVVLLIIFAGLSFFIWQNVYRPFLLIRLFIEDEAHKKAILLDYSNTIEDILRNYHLALSNRDSAQLLKVRAELDAMQSQINPHFLYNTLDCIRNQAIEDGSETTAQMIATLSSLFRYTISQKNDMQTIYQELRNIRNYIKIQQFRFDQKYRLDLRIFESDTEIMEYKIPKLTLQPIIENAIYHGLREKEGEGTITIEASLSRSRLVLSISDDGLGMDIARLQAMNRSFSENEYAVSRKPSGSSDSHGIALINVNARIKLLYGNQYGLSAFSLPGVGTQIQISLPFSDRSGDDS